MTKSCQWISWIVVFWLLGSVCTGSAIGQDDASSHEPSNVSGQSAQKGRETAPNLFGENADSDDSLNHSGPELFADEVDADPPGESLELVQVDVRPGSFGRIDLAIQDQGLVKVLQMLAIQSRRNILPSPNVSGNISAALYDVHFYEALDAILHTNGFRYREDGNFIKVYSAAEFEQLEQLKRKLVTEVVRLNWLTADDAATFLESLVTPDRGSITVSAPATKGFEPSVSEAGQNNWALAVAYAQTGRMAEARTICLRLTRDDPTDHEAWLRLGEIAWADGDRASALLAAERMMRHAPLRQGGYLLAGMVWQASHRPRSGAEAVREGVPTEPAGQHLGGPARYCPVGVGRCASGRRSLRRGAASSSR